MSQSLTQLWIHLVFSTKNRKRVFRNKHDRNRIFSYLAGITQAQKCHPKIVGGHEDHIHMLFLLDKNLPLSIFVQKIKSSSSKWIKQLENKQYENFEWQIGYSAFSVSHSAVSEVYSYILNQEIHHAKRDFQNELLQMLCVNEINFDEKYLWN